ncbi:hypothetical protein CRE_23419 [Caenorhabditis remanei]|uniref:F-box domain-containing protein n=1 Tax=Caenorhabditis remanei TaxID=31234 RepID=E3MGP7_CAERE|nr:hypothetical protein CRE_23419 [Caenorhabditis remanei]
MSPSFLEIPDLPMEMITNNLDYIAIQAVRKTCWGLRNFIDDKKPEACIKKITIYEISDTLVRLAIIFPSSGTYINVRYEKHENGCRLLRDTSEGYKTKIVGNLSFLDAVFHDFKVALNTQKSIFEKVTVTSKTFFEKFEEMMKSQKPIPTESMEIHGNSLEHSRQILQYADPKYLKEIIIYPHGPTSIHETVKIELLKSNQDLSHFSTPSIQLENLDLETLRAIKEVCLFVQMSIYINFFQNFLQFHEYDKYLFVSKLVRENLFINAFGAAFKPPGEKEENWFFNVPGNKEKALKKVM